MTYSDVAPPAAAQTAALAREFVEASRKQAGNMGFDVLEEIGRPNRLAILETWRDKQAYDAHGAAAATTGAFYEYMTQIVHPILQWYPASL